MRIFLYTILSLFCFTSVTAQEVPFEGFHLDDLISIPGERKPGIVNHPVSVLSCSSEMGMDIHDRFLFSVSELY